MPLQWMLESFAVANEGLSWLLGAVGFLVRLRPEFARAYPSVPQDRWLAAHRRAGEEGYVWLDGEFGPPGAAELPLFESHVEIRAIETDDDTRVRSP